MRLDDFRAMVRRMADEVPPEYYEGIADVTVSPRTLPHPVRADIYTLGECIPLPGGELGSTALQSRIVLYHGSFRALADITPGFEWRREAQETLHHELRHHLEWRASAPDLEAYDRAAEHNFARVDGEPFDPLFFLDGEAPAPDVYQVDDDYFLDRVIRQPPESVQFTWHGRAYRVAVPPRITLPAFLLVEGVAEPPPGELVVVVRRRPRIWDLFRAAAAVEVVVQAEALEAPAPPEPST